MWRAEGKERRQEGGGWMEGLMEEGTAGGRDRKGDDRRGERQEMGD